MKILRWGIAGALFGMGLATVLLLLVVLAILFIGNRQNLALTLVVLGPLIGGPIGGMIGCLLAIPKSKKAP